MTTFQDNSLADTTELAKAFDKILQNGSLWICNLTNCPRVKWFASSLTYRLITATVDGGFFECKDINSGVPQGSIL